MTAKIEQLEALAKGMRQMLSAVLNYSEFDTSATTLELYLDDVNEIAPEIKSLRNNLVHVKVEFEKALDILKTPSQVTGP